jgi:hypothetical protein
MDVFSRTFLPASSQAGLPIPVVSRHMQVVRRCVTPAETAMLVARCYRPGQPMAGSFLLLLTNRSLVITRESRLLHRVQLHLAAEVRNLENVAWSPDPRLRSIELAMTTVDGLRERFWIPVRDARRVWHLDALLSHVFRSRNVASRTAPRAKPRLFSPAGAF